jgi:hypothetical protein
MDVFSSDVFSSMLAKLGVVRKREKDDMSAFCRAINLGQVDERKLVDLTYDERQLFKKILDDLIEQDIDWELLDVDSEN